ncbi:MAG: calcium/sodium antiporter [Candidatus Doudnabacteria bacterium]
MLVYILFIIGFVFLIKGADLLIHGSSVIAKRLNVSELVIGLTVVAFGTSAPEFFINVIAAWNQQADIALGNVIGSNIANILLVLGVAALIFPLAVQKGVVWREIPFNLVAALLIVFMMNDIFLGLGINNVITRSEGLVLVGLFGLFLYHIFSVKRAKEVKPDTKINMSWLRSVLYILVGLMGLAVGGDWIVKGAITLAQAFGLSETFVAVTVIALGTSLPELATSVVAAYRRSVDIAVGNIVGSSIFNICLVLGVTAVISPLSVSDGLNLDAGVLVLASLILFIFMFIGRKHVLDRKSGAVFILLYVVYIWMVVVRG